MVSCSAHRSYMAILCVCIFQAYFLYRIDHYRDEKKKTNQEAQVTSRPLTFPKSAATENVEKSLQQRELPASGKVLGVVVLGMGRSGTSLLTGLCIKALHYKSPGRLKSPRKKANAKGYFENVHLILQNEVWLAEQGTKMYQPNLQTSPDDSSVILNGFSWDASCATDSCLETSKIPRNKTLYFQNRNQVLRHYNNPSNSPWIMKDPRLCLTLKLWLQVLDGPPPAVIFVFRDPLDNALSHKTRSDPGSLDIYFRLWIWYNRLAIENSRGLCRVVTRYSPPIVLKSEWHFNCFLSSIFLLIILLCHILWTQNNSIRPGLKY
jgi:hypothetical protein